MKFRSRSRDAQHPLSLIIVITAGISIGALTMIIETRGRDLTTIDVEPSQTDDSGHSWS
ncbi:hypothetical protein [Rhodococcus sp. 1168]|uniref:hypothetical protein n=1 Tax=Rhodococcus sp. 1168 TaxID=2018041 RepID=UPI001593ED1B|nr:hypothetical protein [Rhodococcus sp. 1168]